MDICDVNISVASQPGETSGGGGGVGGGVGGGDGGGVGAVSLSVWLG